MSALMQRLIKSSTIEDTSVLTDSKIYGKKDMIPTPIPALNIALSGKLDGGLTPGLTMWAGVSKMFKTGFSLLMAKAYMDKYPDSVLLFYDSEFGSPQSYFNSFGIDLNRVLHSPITDIEQLKFDIMKQLEGIERGDRVKIIIDSIGNLASKKEVEDALEGKSVADMSRAKQVKSLFRMVTPHLSLKDIPMVVVNHTYKEIGMFPKDIVGGIFGGQSVDQPTKVKRTKHGRSVQSNDYDSGYAGSSSHGSGGSRMVASFYGHGERLSRHTASGAVFNPHAYTAAHKTLPFGTHLRVCHNGCVTVVVNDRGPFVRGRSLDLSYGAARAIGMGSTKSISVERLN